MLRTYPIVQVMPPTMVTILHPNLLTSILASKPEKVHCRKKNFFNQSISRCICLTE
jgi:hypothetical protein